MEIIIENENTQLVEYKINFEQAKAYLQEELQRYQKLVVTDEFMQMAKKSRAELNAKKKELSARFTSVKKKHNEPIDLLKEKVDELLKLIDEPLEKIDEQIKAYEVKVKQQKHQMILDIFEEIKNSREIKNIELSKIYNPKWLNVDYSKKKIVEEITLFFDRCKKDLEVIESFDDEFVIPLRELYMTCFDMSTVMQKKIAYDKEKQRKFAEEQERLKKEYELKKLEEELNNKKLDEPQEPISDFSGTSNINTPKDEISLDTEVPTNEVSGKIEEEIPTQNENDDKIELEYIEFWVRVTPEQKLLMRNFVLDNHIKCGKVVR